MVERIDIERGLDKLAADESGFKFQSLAVVLGKLRWPELIASERHKDQGLDAYAPASACADGRGKGLACSTTGTLRKVTEDAEEAKKHYADVSLLVFYTAEKVTQPTKARWADKIRELFGYELIVASREDIITSLQLPDNVQLCRTHLDIAIPYQAPLSDLLPCVRVAAGAVASGWAAHPRLSGKPQILLNAVALGTNGADTAEIANTDVLRSLLMQGRRIVLEGPAGRGKTTTLIQIAARSENAPGIPLLIDLPNWIRSGRDILDYVASSPAFRENHIDAAELARVPQTEPFLFLLNGWNEITEFYTQAAIDALHALERGFPTVGIIVATRTHHIVPPLPGATRFRLLPLSAAQRYRYLAEALGENAARELSQKLTRDPALDDLTRTPFILAEVTTLFRSQAPIPNTKLALLKAVLDLTTHADEHAGHLQATPLRGLSEHYLRALAMHLTACGDVSLADREARSVCHRVGEQLRGSGQHAVAPEPADVLSGLTAHHVLERIDYPATSFRFEHQQFQEYYAAVVLLEQIRSIAASHDTAEASAFTQTYINIPSWEEALRMIAADLGSESNDIAAGKLLVLLALRLDAVFAARLAYVAGTGLWPEIRADMHDRLRALYNAPSGLYRTYALTAMLATGSDEFADIIMPLLTSPDQQIRLQTYRCAMPFHPSTLGAQWRQCVAGWSEPLRVEFVGELTTHQGNLDIGVMFARTDLSIAVRTAALHGLCWFGQRDTVTAILQSLSDSEFDQVIANFHVEDIPSTQHTRAKSTFQSLLVRTTDHKARLRITLTLAQLNDSAAPTYLKAEMEALPVELVRELGDYLLRDVVGILRAADGPWLCDWVIHRVMQGVLWRDDWLSLIQNVAPSLRDDLLHRAATEDLRRAGAGGAIAILRAAPDADLAEAVFHACCDHRRGLQADPQNQEKQAIDFQLRGLLRSLPRALVIDGLSELLQRPPVEDTFHSITELFGLREADGDEAQDSLPEPQRQRIRSYFKSALPFVLSQDDYSGQMKGYLSAALSRVGDACDMVDVLQLIRADINRLNESRAALARGERPARGRGSSMSWSPWHVEALMRLGARESESILLDVINDPNYEVDACWALALLARRVPPEPNTLMGARHGHPTRDYRRIRSATADWRALHVEHLRVTYASAIRRRMATLLEEAKTANPRTTAYPYRLKEIAKALAALDPQDSADFILDVAELPARADGWSRIALIESLVFAGVTPPMARVMAILEPVLAQFRAHGVWGNDSGLLTRALTLLPFVDDPKHGIALIRELLSEFRMSWYGNRDLLFAIAQCPDESALTFLCDIRDHQADAFQHVAKDWLEAIVSCSLPAAQAVLLAFVDLEAQPPSASASLIPDYAVGFLASQIAALARADSSIVERLCLLTTRTLTAQQRTILAKVLPSLASTPALLHALNLVDDASTEPIPYEVFRAIEDLILEKRPVAAHSQSYTLVPRSAHELKTRLFDMATRDARRTNSAYRLLAQIEDWRLEYGRPPSEPRNPVSVEQMPWPPLCSQ